MAKATSKAVSSVIKRLWDDELMLGHVLKVSAVGYEKLPCTMVRVKRNEFNSFLNAYYGKSVDFWALTNGHPVNIGDVVLLRKLAAEAAPTITHRLERIVYRYGHRVDPITKRRVIGERFEDERARYNQLIASVLSNNDDGIEK